jgi:glutamate--cysteine ligase catalytic subunit
MVALSVASSIYRGYLADIDARWNVIAGSVDDRSRQERGSEPLNDDSELRAAIMYDFFRYDVRWG